MSEESKKLLYIGLEPDMWFELADILKQFMIDIESSFKVQPYPISAKSQNKLLYLKAIVSLLETQLTH